MKRRGCLGALGLALMAPCLALAAPAPALEVKDILQGYRVIHLTGFHEASESVQSYQVWFARQPFAATGQAELHSVLRVGSTAGLERVDAERTYEKCWSDGLSIHRDPAGAPVIARSSRQWSCALAGMSPGLDHWFAVVPVDGAGQALIDIEALKPVKGRTDIPDPLPTPPDARPVVTALASIVIALIALLLYLGRRDWQGSRSRGKLAHLYVAPALVALAALSFYPVSYGIWLSFTDAHQSRLGQESFIGLANFATLLSSPGIARVTLFTLVWALANVSFHLALGLLLALALTRDPFRGRLFYRTLLLLPWAIPAYISILAWRGILGAEGLLNQILGTQIDFLSEPLSAQALVIIVNIWLGVPFMMMALSGALTAIPKDMYEAAQLEGVSPWQQFRHLTLPNLKTAIIPLSLLGFIWSFNMFTVIFLMTRGNPAVGFGEPGATDILITYVYDLAFDYGRYGEAAAWSVAIFLMLLTFCWVYAKKTSATEAVA